MQYQTQQRLVRSRRSARKRSEEREAMTNELLKQYIGRTCRISTGSYGTSIVGKITDVKDNWVAIDTRKGVELINAEYIQSIKILP